MTKKNFKLKFQVFGSLIVVCLIAVSFFIGNKINTPQSNSVLGTSTTKPTKAGQIASAAYSKCIENGGFVTTARRPSNGFYNVCNFEDDMNCELYSLYSGDCPVGGVKTIGYTTTDQVFCALRGGKPQGNKNGQCKMPNGKTCTTASVYNGTCEPN